MTYLCVCHEQGCQSEIRRSIESKNILKTSDSPCHHSIDALVYDRKQNFEKARFGNFVAYRFLF